MNRDEDGWTKVYQERQSLWIGDENPQRPHALLREGNHSNGFFFSKIVIDDPILRREAAEDMLEKLLWHGLDIYSVDCVVGPATGATLLAEELSTLITKKRYEKWEKGDREPKKCRWASPEKTGNGKDRTMVFPLLGTRGSDIRMGDRVLIVEDVVTTGRSSELTQVACEQKQCRPLSIQGVLVNRSGVDVIKGRRIIALIKKYLPTWKPEECPRCQDGSEAISPKKPEGNWALLNASY